MKPALSGKEVCKKLSTLQELKKQEKYSVFDRHAWELVEYIKTIPHARNQICLWLRFLRIAWDRRMWHDIFQYHLCAISPSPQDSAFVQLAMSSIHHAKQRGAMRRQA